VNYYSMRNIGNRRNSFKGVMKTAHVMVPFGLNLIAIRRRMLLEDREDLFFSGF